jgi:aminoglycoside phosphotransferase family enzyme
MPESSFSIFGANQCTVAKIRKTHSAVVGRINSEISGELARTEFSRGRILQPDLYLDWQWVPCLKVSNHHCAAALLMNRLPDTARLDRVVIDSGGVEGELLIDMLFLIYRDLEKLLDRAEPVKSGSTLESLRVSSVRLVERLERACNGQTKSEIIALWSKQAQIRERLMDEMMARDRAGCLKSIHGDLTPTNMFFKDGNSIFIDPCAAFADMYALDEAVDKAGLVVTSGELGGLYVAQEIFYMSQIGSSISLDLFSFFVMYVALIRWSVSLLTGTYAVDALKEIAEWCATT